MRFKCGQCDTNYNYNSDKITSNGVILKCKNCDNKFAINKNHVIKAKDDNSVRYCSNCNYPAPINAHSCSKCGLHFNIGKISLIIDNNDYTNIDEKSSPAQQTFSFLGRHRTSVSIITGALIIAVIVILFIPFSTFTKLKNSSLELLMKDSTITSESNNLNADTINIQGKFLISLIDGGQITASTINFDEQQVKIIDNKGMEITVNKRDISGIADMSSSK